MGVPSDYLLYTQSIYSISNYLQKYSINKYILHKYPLYSSILDVLWAVSADLFAHF